MTPQELARLLGLGPNELKLTDTQALSYDHAARGYAAEPLESIASRLDREGDVVDVLPAAGGVVQHLQWALGTYFVAPSSEREHVEVVIGAYLKLTDGELLVSARQGPAVVRITAPGSLSKAYLLEHGRAELWLTGNPADSHESVMLAVPELSSFTGGVAGAADLEAEFEQLRTSGVLLDRLAAPGLLLRFWVPSDREARRQQLVALAVENSPLAIAVRSWYSSLGAATRDGASNIAVAEISGLKANLAELATTETESVTRELAARVALGRDRLESVRRVLLGNGEGSALTIAIRSLDDLAATHLTQLADVGVAADGLRRVLASEPDAWWGVISD